MGPYQSPRDICMTTCRYLDPTVNPKPEADGFGWNDRSDCRACSLFWPVCSVGAGFRFVVVTVVGVLGI